MLFHILCYRKESSDPINLHFHFTNPTDDHIIKSAFMTLNLNDIQQLTKMNCYQNKEYYKSFDFINDTRLDRMRNDYIDDEIALFI